MSDPQGSDPRPNDGPPRELSDEEINAAGPEASKQASSPLYATETPTLHEDVEPSRGGEEGDAGDTRDTRDT